MFSETAIYNKSGERISHYKGGDPESLNFANANPIPPKSIMSLAQRIACNEQLRTPLLSQRQGKDDNLTYISNTPNGDGVVLYGRPKKISDPDYHSEILIVYRYHDDHDFGELFPNQTIRGLPQKFRTMAQSSRVNCTSKKAEPLKTEYFNADGVLEFINTVPRAKN